MAVAIAFGSRSSGTSTSSSLTLASMTFNAEASDRIIAVTLAQEDSDVISTVTIGGVAATVRAAAVASTTRRSEIWAAAVPTGTTGSVVITLTSGDASISCATFSITGADETPTDSDSATGTGASVSITALTIATDGAGIGGYCNSSQNDATTWTGASVSHDNNSTTFRHSSAIITTAGTNTVTADGGDFAQALVGVAFGPASGGGATSLPIFSRPPRFMRRRAA